MNFELFNGDCLEVLKELPDNIADSIVTDPPAGISFMGKSWDEDKGGRKEWIRWLTEVMKEARRVLKPGAHALVWAIPRTSHWTATALEDAGFEIRDVVTHIFGSGFPKSLSIDKAIDKAAGAEREVISSKPRPATLVYNHSGIHDIEALKKVAEEFPDKVLYKGETAKSIYNRCLRLLSEPMRETIPSTPEAKQWQGWGTALKPASEHWILARKPLSEKTVAANVLKHGTGGLNIDASRIGTSTKTNAGRANTENNRIGAIKGYTQGTQSVEHNYGRFPANLVLSHNPDCVEVGVKKAGSGSGSGYNFEKSNNDNPTHITKNIKSGVHYGTETVPAWECSEGCAVAELDRQSGVLKTNPGTYRREKRNGAGNTYTLEGSGVTSLGDSGGASRFFYCAKASKSDKGKENTHPTVKSTKLMEYLIKLITPENGVVLDPFTGSGSTGISALKSGFVFIGIEKELEYFEIAQKRLQAADIKIKELQAA